MIPVSQPHIGQKEKEYVADAVESGWVSSSGAYIGRFETALQSYLGAPHVLSTSNGTTALHLALLAIGVGPDDEVIIPASSFIATVNAVLYVGATPVFVDIEEHAWGIAPDRIEEKITKKTKAIIAVHLYGYGCHIAHVKEVADAHDLWLIEDNAESIGATWQGTRLGTVGDIGIYSFYGNKIITTGEGGAVSTANGDLFERMSILKNHGRKTNGEYIHEMCGYNYRMTNMQAALGCAQLEQIDDFLAARRHIEELYDGMLGTFFTRQIEYPDTAHVMWLYSGLVPVNVGVDAVRVYLKEHGVDTRPLFYPMNKMPYMDPSLRSEEYPMATQLYTRGVTLPTFVGLTDRQIETVCEHLQAVCK